MISSTLLWYKTRSYNLRNCIMRRGQIEMCNALKGRLQNRTIILQEGNIVMCKQLTGRQGKQGSVGEAANGIC